MPATHKVRVPASAGEAIHLSYAGDPTVTYQVKDRQVTVRDEHLHRFLGAVEGSTTVGAAGSQKEN